MHRLGFRFVTLLLSFLFSFYPGNIIYAYAFLWNLIPSIQLGKS